MPVSALPVVYRFTWRGSIFGQQCLNVFYYGCANVISDLTALALAQQGAIAGDLFNVISNKYLQTRLSVEGVKGDTSFASVPVATGGFVSSDTLPPFVSWDFTMIRAGGGERNGFKRFAGVPEAFQVDGVATNTALSLLQIAAPLFSDDITVGGDTITPLIRRTVIHHVPQHPPAYYTMGETTYAGIGSQNTRKFGRGA